MTLTKQFIGIKRHFSFLKTVLVYTLSAFGGPNVHISLIVKYFTKEKKYFTQEEVMEYFSACQMIPGPSSTQLLMLIAHKRGGMLLSFITFLIWILPSTILMTAYSICILHPKFQMSKMYFMLELLEPLAVGFIIYGTIVLFKNTVKDRKTFLFFIINSLILIALFRTPWVFPIVIIFSFVTYYYFYPNTKPIEKKSIIFKAINWKSLVIFFALFVLLGYLSEYSRVKKWETRAYFNILENNYRFGSLVYGGGNVLVPMMFEQYCVRKKSQWVSKDKFLAGVSLQQTVPGPTFSLATYIGNLVYYHHLKKTGILGALLATIGIFLPGILLLFFWIPIWDKLKQYSWINRAFNSIHIAVVSMMFVTCLVIFKHTFFQEEINLKRFLVYSVILVLTPTLLLRTKVRPVFLVIAFIALSFFIHYLKFI